MVIALGAISLHGRSDQPCMRFIVTNRDKNRIAKLKIRPL